MLIAQQPLISRLGRMAATAAALLAAGCSSLQVEMNDPLPTAATLEPARADYRFGRLAEVTGSSDTTVYLAFSGGGKRSSAFSYGVLRGLADIDLASVGRGGRLLDEVDVISSVSGGSFTSAYFGLHRDAIFRDFEGAFLKRDIESYIYGIYLLPWHWDWLVNPLTGTNDHMATIYDDLMFGGARYADLQRRGRPLIMIQATDVSYGTVFSFTQPTFDLICSDLGSLRLSKAVAASNGFPILFTPVTLTNHAERCPAAMRPSWLKAASELSDPFSRHRSMARQMLRYGDPTQTRYIHLMDGGIADNLALRGFIDLTSTITEETLTYASLEQLDLARVRRILMVSVDGQAAADSSWAQERVLTGLSQIFSAVSGTQIDRYNFETLVLARQDLQSLAAHISRARCAHAATIDGHPCDDVQVFFDHISLSQITDPALRQKLQSIPTGLSIPDEDVDLLVAMGRDLALGSTELQRFVRSLAPRSTEGSSADRQTKGQ